GRRHQTNELSPYAQENDQHRDVRHHRRMHARRGVRALLYSRIFVMARGARAQSRFLYVVFFFAGRRRHTSSDRDWSSDVCSSDLRELDALREKGKGAIGTTRRGIGPAYEAKMARRGIRIADLGKPARLAELVERNLDE